MIPFSDLQKQADAVAEKVGQCVKISVDYWNYESGSRKLVYGLYITDFRSTSWHATVQELQQAMENIINPPEDQGVSL